MNNTISKNTLDNLRRRYPAGTCIELIQMNDPYTKLKSGDRGTVSYVDDIGTVHVSWDSGSSLGLVYGEDLYRVVEKVNDL